MPIDRIIDPNAAASVYAKNSKMGQNIVSGGEDKNDVKFSDFLRAKASDSIQTIKTGETTSAKAVTGQADITEVIQAVTSAELTLQTVVAVRDRMITAYQEIMRMPI